ncbi:hypothetical protein D3C81_1977410 [compost metagenome]
MPVLAQQCAGERAHEQADRHEEHPDDAAQEGSPQGLAAGTYPLCADHRGQDVHGERQQGQQAQDRQRQPAHMDEIVGPCRQHQPGEHQRDAGQGGKNHAGNADEHQNDG